MKSTTNKPKIMKDKKNAPLATSYIIITVLGILFILFLVFGGAFYSFNKSRTPTAQTVNEEIELDTVPFKSSVEDENNQSTEGSASSFINKVSNDGFVDISFEEDSAESKTVMNPFSRAIKFQK